MNSLRYCDFGGARPFLLLVGRILMVVLFLISDFPKLTGFEGTVQYMASLGTPAPTIAAAIAVLMEVFGSILVVLGFFTRPLAIIFAVYTLATGFIGHPYWTMTGDAVMPNMINFYKNLSITGGFLLLALVGPGALSLDRR
ncbi:DoxX family protein [Shimwellia pseudoproteus]|uniref:DoxX family protein n=1 Tax=Shimwellia pseudoproteus TaxID=570012 RepID=UPI0018EBB1BA|nr:DoxX family protein [Shimwellia pseudoproteus]MBJ3816544.1 DoxX family protein [Shimwellia pseudoproteus]